MQQFEHLCAGHWQEVFGDPCTEDYRRNWTLDGLKATITHSPEGMDFVAGPEISDDCHAVLWPRPSFEGDLKIEYEYTRLDQATKYVNILYIQAAGNGVGPFAKDISQWAQLRQVASMRMYYEHMHLYHISYAAFECDNEDPLADYIRARRYLPGTMKALEGTDLRPDHLATGLFAPGVPHRITVIKTANELFMRVRNGDKSVLCHWPTGSLPPVVEGRIGLRHMVTRAARYCDFRVWRIAR